MFLISVITPILYFSFNIKLELNSENVKFIIITITFCTLSSFIKNYITLKIIYHYSSQSVSFLRISQSFGSSISKFIDILGNDISEEWKIVFII